MTQVFLSIGSNVERDKHIRAGLAALEAAFGDVQLSPVYESAAVGFDGDAFLNLVAEINTDLSVGELAKTLKAIEDQNGRLRNVAKFSSRTLDIDILTYGDAVGVIDGVELPRDEIIKYAFVLKPLVDLAPTQQHPEHGVSYQQLWQQGDFSAQLLEQVPW